MRDFNKWLRTFKSSIANYNYYTDFETVLRHVDGIKVELNILNSLIASKSIEKDFRRILEEYPKTLRCIPILLAVRSFEIEAIDAKGELLYRFDKINLSIDDYAYFMRETGLFSLLENHLVSSLIDYVTGVEVGLNSNGRKNRGGHLMEDIVEDYIKSLNVNYYKEMYAVDIERRWGFDLSAVVNEGKTAKRFDFVIENNGCIFVFETNFYKSGGSKLNETARSYKGLAQSCSGIHNLFFVWITDGHGWYSAKKNLLETFEAMEHIYNLNDLENGALIKLVDNTSKLINQYQ